ncbi:MAG: GNAT family acetyltransferase [Geminicoccaceae bacterium]|nr:GNAT family acetyltransferase [Geminicoccaceae bacterium]
MRIRPIQDRDVPAVVALWETCGLTRPWNPPAADIARARGRPNSEVLVAERAGRIVGTVMVGEDGHRGWVYYLAVEPAARGGGLGRALMAAAEAWLVARGIRKLELLVRSTNAAVKGFYEGLGYREEPVAVLARWLDGTVPGETGGPR